MFAVLCAGCSLECKTLFLLVRDTALHVRKRISSEQIKAVRLGHYEQDLPGLTIRCDWLTNSLNHSITESQNQSENKTTDRFGPNC